MPTVGLQNHFAQYGEVTDAVIMVDPVSAKPRGFGFVTFKDPLIVHSVCEQPHTLDGKKVIYRCVHNYIIIDIVNDRLILSRQLLGRLVPILVVE